MVSEPGFYPVYTPAHMEPSSAAMDIVQRTENMIFDRALNQRKASFFFRVRQTAEICRWLAESFDACAVELPIVQLFSEIFGKFELCGTELFTSFVLKTFD